MKIAPEIGKILAATEKVKAHKIFNRSPLMCAFLSYVTQETLQGRESRISAYSVAVDALGKPTDFDPQMDPSVRVLAKRLRDSLDRYYDEATDYDICIILKPGSYVPSFTSAEHRVAEPNPIASVVNSLKDPSLPDDKISWTTPVVYFRSDESSKTITKK